MTHSQEPQEGWAQKVVELAAEAGRENDLIAFISSLIEKARRDANEAGFREGINAARNCDCEGCKLHTAILEKKIRRIINNPTDGK